MMVVHQVERAGFAPEEFLLDRCSPPLSQGDRRLAAAVYVDNAAVVGTVK